MPVIEKDKAVNFSGQYFLFPVTGSAPVVFASENKRFHSAAVLFLEASADFDHIKVVLCYLYRC